MSIGLSTDRLIQHVGAYIQRAAQQVAQSAYAARRGSGLEGVIAHNTIHHSRQYPSKIVLTVVKRQLEPTTTAVAAVHQ